MPQGSHPFDRTGFRLSDNEEIGGKYPLPSRSAFAAELVPSPSRAFTALRDMSPCTSGSPWRPGRCGFCRYGASPLRADDLDEAVLYVCVPLRVTCTFTSSPFLRIMNSPPNFFGMGHISRPHCVAISAPFPPRIKLTV